MKTSDFILYALATAVGTLVALALWSLAVKLVADKVIADAQQTPAAKLLSFLR